MWGCMSFEAARVLHRETHLFGDEFFQPADFLVISVEQAQKTCLRARGALGAASGQLIQTVLDLR